LTGIDLAAERRDYTGPRLLESEAPADPFELFSTWLAEALAANVLDATAMSLSSCSVDGAPSSRTVLLKGQDRRGFVFYTRYSTRKGTELAANPRAALLFHWRELNRQVNVEGSVERLSRQESEAYFATRPRESQLAARAASGLDRVADASVLEQRLAAETARWLGRAVEMPLDWGGYRVGAQRFEFWQGRPSRFHDRLVYEPQADGTWLRYRLAP
jgi:pyridoxamine 5'-phosphate oxidase